MIRVISMLLGLALITLIVYLFLNSNISAAIVVIMGSVVVIPIVMHMVNGGLYFGSKSADSTSSNSGSADGGIGAFGGGLSGGNGGGSGDGFL